MKTLVVYYSRSGTTRKVAQAIARDLGADTEEIRDPTDRRGLLGYLRSSIEATLARPAPIQPGRHDPAEYDVVVVGTPVWNASVSAPVRAFLARHGGQCGALAFFVTEGGRGEARVFGQMADLANAQPLATLTVTRRALRSDGASAAIRSFAGELRASGRVGTTAPASPGQPHATP